MKILIKSLIVLFVLTVSSYASSSKSFNDAYSLYIQNDSTYKIDMNIITDNDNFNSNDNVTINPHTKSISQIELKSTPNQTYKSDNYLNFNLAVYKYDQNNEKKLITTYSRKFKSAELYNIKKQQQSLGILFKDNALKFVKINNKNFDMFSSKTTQMINI